MTPSERERRIYRIEVCQICGGHLNNRYNRPGQDGSSAPTGRCLLDVTPVPIDQQREPRSLRHLVANGIVPSFSGEEGTDA